MTLFLEAMTHARPKLFSSKFVELRLSGMKVRAHRNSVGKRSIELFAEEYIFFFQFLSEENRIWSRDSRKDFHAGYVILHEPKFYLPQNACNYGTPAIFNCRFLCKREKFKSAHPATATLLTISMRRLSVCAQILHRTMQHTRL